MGRDLRFRAWHKKLQRMYDALELHLYPSFPSAKITYSQGELEDLYEMVLTVSLDQIDLMQFTGMKDKHGASIYEGDIVRGEEGDTCVVEWEENIDRDRYWATANGFGIYFKASHASPDRVEVIGNVYETPERLEGRNT